VAPHEASSPLHLCCPVISNNKADACNSDHDDDDNDTLSPTVSLQRERRKKKSTLTALTQVQVFQVLMNNVQPLSLLT
jgi:hypothetical protein